MLMKNAARRLLAVILLIVLALILGLGLASLEVVLTILEPLLVASAQLKTSFNWLFDSLVRGLLALACRHVCFKIPIISFLCASRHKYGVILDVIHPAEFCLIFDIFLYRRIGRKSCFQFILLRHYFLHEILTVIILVFAFMSSHPSTSNVLAFPLFDNVPIKVLLAEHLVKVFNASVQWWIARLFQFLFGSIAVRELPVFLSTTHLVVFAYHRGLLPWLERLVPL